MNDRISELNEQVNKLVALNQSLSAAEVTQRVWCTVGCFAAFVVGAATATLVLSMLSK